MPKPSRQTPQKRVGKLNDQLCFALYAATNATTRVYRPLLAKIGLSYPQYLVLLVLWERGPTRLGEIADQLQLATHALSPIVDRLEEANLVARKSDGTDGRAVIVHLTSSGVRLKSKAAAVQSEVREKTAMNMDEVARLREELIHFAARMNHEGESDLSA